MKQIVSILTIFLGIVTFSLGCSKSKNEAAPASTAVTPAPAPQKPVVVETGPKTVGLLMSKGRLLKMKEDGSGDEVTAEVVLANGTKVSKEGKILFPDGRKMAFLRGPRSRWMAR